MATDWVSGFFVPLIEVVFIGGIITYVGYIIVKAFRNAWRKSAKFTLRYGLWRKPYPESIVKWCYDAIDKGIGYYDAKKFLMVKMIPDEQVDETMWIYDKILIQLKGGIDRNGRQFKGSHSTIEVIKGELPSI